jgi:hypothetical protein
VSAATVSAGPDLSAQRRKATRTAYALGALALAFFLASFVMLAR